MSSKLRWGILSTGRIAGRFADDLAKSRYGLLAAVASRTLAPAQEFAARFNAARAHGSYEALLADPEVDAVYVATPHPAHLKWAVAAAKAGKHVLCEKPLALNHPQGLRIVEAARVGKVALMEAFMYRCHPQTHKLVELIRSGTLGDITLVQASFGFRAEFNAEARLWSKDLAGGGILDVGCYPVSLARLVAGAAAGKPFLDPLEITATGHLHRQTGVDTVAAAQLRFENGVIAQVSTSITTSLENAVHVYGTLGSVSIPSPWLPDPAGGAVSFWLRREGLGMERIEVPGSGPLYALEADALAEAVVAGRTEVPYMSWADTIGNLKTLDRWRAALNLVYPGE